MDVMTFLGFILGIAAMIFGILMGGELKTFYDLGSIYITVGGTVATMMMNFPGGSLKELFKIYMKAFFPKKLDPPNSIEIIVNLAEEARKSGLLSLEEKVQQYDDEFLKNGVMLIMDAYEPEMVRDILETKLAYTQERHKAAISMLEKAAAYAPAFGMIGTLIGLINMLLMLDNPDTLGPNMAIALITTFYGAIMANLLFLPIAGKLKVRDEEEALCKQLIIEGVISIQAGENPRIIRDKLYSFLAPKMRNTNKARKIREQDEAYSQAAAATQAKGGIKK